VDTSDLQKRLKNLIGEEIPRRTLWRWVKQGRVAPPDRVPRGKGRGRGRHVEWSEEAVGDITTLLAVRKIRRAKAFRIKKEWTFSSGALLEAISLAYADKLPVKHGSDTVYVEDSFFRDEDTLTSRGATIDVFGFKHIWKGIAQGVGADIRLANLDSHGCKQAFLLPSPFIPLQGEPRISPDDAVHAGTIAAAVIAFEKEKKGWPRRPARVVFSWYLEFPLIGLSPYAHKADWDSHDYDHVHDYDMVCIRDDVLIEDADSDELIICLDARVVLDVRGGAVQAYLPWFMARRGYRSGQSGRRYPGLPPIPSYLRSKPTRANEHKSFRIRRREHRAVSDRAPPRDGIRRRVKNKSGYFRPWKRRRAKRPVGTSAPAGLIDINSIRPRSFPD
jgi:hypothetical protein